MRRSCICKSRSYGKPRTRSRRSTRRKWRRRRRKLLKWRI